MSWPPPNWALVVNSPGFQETLNRLELSLPPIVRFGDEYEQLISLCVPTEPDAVVDAEDALVIVYSSGNAGLPKSAVISHMAS